MSQVHSSTAACPPKSKPSTYKDTSARRAIRSTERRLSADPQKKLSGEEMTQLVRRATQDKDSQAAGQEHKDLSAFVAENKDRLSPEAEAAWSVYDKVATEQTAKGETGIPNGLYQKTLRNMRRASHDASKHTDMVDCHKPQHQDATSGAAVEALKASPKPISGEALEQAVISGTQDMDGQAAGKEYNDLSRFVGNNWKSMSPNAKAKWRVYEAKVQQCRCQGKTGIPAGEYNQMKKDMAAAGYQDAGAGQAIEGLRAQGSPITGDKLQTAVENATKDLDGQAAGKEFDDLNTYMKANWSQLTPQAKAKWAVYEDKVCQCRDKGQTGIPSGEYKEMLQDMKTAGYNDAGAGSAIEGLKAGPKPISAEAMEKAIIDGTKDWDGQAAGTEYQDFKTFVKENWSDLSPGAKAKFGVYSDTAELCNAFGLSGIPGPLYGLMKMGMANAGYNDAGAGRALQKLDQQPKPVSGQAMEKAIVDATKDFDNNAAGGEFKDVSNWARENWNNMSPDAKAKYQVYERCAERNAAKGRTGIPVKEYGRMVRDMRKAGFEDASSGAAVNKLDQAPRPISGADLFKAVKDGTKDLDAQAAGKEFRDLNGYVKENWSDLSPDAKAKWGVYESTARDCQAKGMTGIPHGQYNQMLSGMSAAKAKPQYQDATAGRAIEGLKTKPKPVSGQHLQNAIIDATKDTDAQAAGNEFNDLNKYVKSNWKTMSPDAKAKWRVYESAAQKAQCQGKSGIAQSDYRAMVKDMKATSYQDASSGAAVEGLHAASKPVSGDDFQKAIIAGTKDHDAQAAGKEYADLSKYVSEHGASLSPEAKAKWEVYEKCAKANKAKGRSGIPSAEYKAMVAEMKVAGYQDKTTGAAIEGLKAGPKPVSGASMEQAIIAGTRDLDAQAAGKEFNDLKKYVTENEASLSPEAKAKWRTYERYAESAQARGHTGIPAGEYGAMKAELAQTGYRDGSSAVACELLDAHPGKVGRDAMLGAFALGTADSDGRAFGREYEDLAQWVDTNKSRMTPEATAAWNVYENAAETARDNGQFGLPANQYDQLFGQMAFASESGCGQASLLSQFLRI